jgi:hypothetical protein
MVATDRLALAHAFEDAGLPRDKAEAVAGTIMDAIHDNVATKGDLAELRTAMKSDLAELRMATKSDLGELRAATRSDLAELKSDFVELKSDLGLVEQRLEARIDLQGARIDLIEHRLLARLGALVVVVAGVLFALLRLWPPHP